MPPLPKHLGCRGIPPSHIVHRNVCVENESRKINVQCEMCGIAIIHSPVEENAGSVRMPAGWHGGMYSEARSAAKLKRYTLHRLW